MDNKIMVIVSLFLLAACATQYGALGGQGRAVFTITDAAANMGAVTSIKVTVDSVQAHSATEGWATVSSQTQTFDLLQLKAQGTQALLADINLKAGTYEQVRLDISKVIVTDASGDHEAKLPSGELKIIGDLTVNANSTSTATFDFIADESLHVTGKGEYILAPVVKLETRENADVDTSSRADVKVRNGRVKTNVKVGMNERGEVGIGLQVRRDLNLTIDNQGNIKIGPIVSARAKAQGEMKRNESGKGEVGANVSVSIS